MVDHHQIPEPVEQVGDEAPHIVARLDRLLHHPEQPGTIVISDSVDDGVEQRVVRHPELLGNLSLGEALGPRPCDQLAHDALRVADASSAGARDQGQRGRLVGHRLGITDTGKVGHQLPRRHEPERVVERPRPDRGQNLVDLGGGEDELDVLGRLLDQLQQGVEAVLADHVGLIDDVDLETRLSGDECRALSQFTRVIHTTVAGGIQFDHVHQAAAVGGEGHAEPAHATRVRRGTLLAQ